jgi:predicted 2-oxoglutarate/Fe(II)-dependent dioxygenase YbiX
MKSAPPPHIVYQDFLAEEDRAAILAHLVASEARFTESRVFGGAVKPDRRLSRSLHDCGPAAALLERALRSHLPAIFADLHTRPFALARVEIEAVAYGDGARFAAHTDLAIGAGRRQLEEVTESGSDRLLSGVYYLHGEPKKFSGGALRLYGFHGEGAPARHIDIEPAQNSLVVFPSWVRHEVTKVDCPSGAFADHRFAVNCWLRRARPPASEGE